MPTSSKRLLAFSELNHLTPLNPPLHNFLESFENFECETISRGDYHVEPFCQLLNLFQTIFHFAAKIYPCINKVLKSWMNDDEAWICSGFFLKFSDFLSSLFLFTFSLVRDRVFLKPKFDWLQAFRSTKFRHEYIVCINEIYFSILFIIFLWCIIKVKS